MRIMTPLNRTTCPFCFEEFHLSDAPWRPLADVDLRPDVHVQRFFDLNEPPMLPAVVPPHGTDDWKSWARQRFVLDNARIRDHDRVCPHCHMPLPLATATGELKSEVIAIVGERWSGKSSYYGVLLHLLINGNLAGDAGFGIIAQTSWDVEHLEKVSSSTFYADRYGYCLFPELFSAPDGRGAGEDGIRRRRIPPTPRLRDHPELRAPLIYRLQFYARGPDGRMARPARIVKATDLVLFDTGGEDLEDPKTMALTLRYLTRAAAIIFLVNPLRLQGIRTQLSDEVRVRLPERERELPSVSSDILDTYLNLFDRNPRHGALKPIEVPVAIVLTKIDVLKDLDLIDPGSRLWTPSEHRHGFDAEDAGRVSAEVRGYLDRWAGGMVGTKLDRFTNSGYFAVSSLGCQPNEDDTIPTFQPRRVTDPLFWILHKLGYLPARRATVGGGV